MDCLSSTLEGGNNRKQVRFVSPLINHRQTSLLSPPPTPRLSPVLTPPQSPPLTLNTVNRKSLINNNSVHQRHLIPSRSLTNSPKRILQKEKLPEQFPQKSLALRFVKTLISHSQSYDSFQLSPKMSTTKQPKIITRSKQLTLPTSFSLNSIKSASSNSAIYQLILREERNRSFDEFNQKLQGNHRSSSSSSCPPPVAVSFPSKHRCCFHPEGVVLGHNSFEPSFSNSFNPLLLTNTTTTFNGGSNSSCGSGGVNIYSRAASAVLDETKKKKEKKRPPLLCHFHKPFESQKISSLFQSSQKRIFVWPPTFLSGQIKKRLPNSYTFPPPLIMNASPSHQQQQSYNELEDFDEDFVPRSSNASKINNKNSMEGHIEEKTQIRRMSLKEFSGLDLLEEHANQKAASNLSPMLHPWRSGQQLTLGSLIDKFSNRRRSSSSGGAKIEASLQHSHSEDGYNSFDRALDLINQAIRETINAGNAEQNSTNGSIEKNGKQASNHLEKQYSSTGRNTLGQTLQRLTNIRNHLNSTLQSVPNASPRKATSLEPDCEKLVLLNECKILVNACKDMIRNANTSSPPTSQTSDLSLLQNCSNDCHMSNKKYIFILFFKVVQIVVDSAERAIDSVEMLIRKSNSIFQAQQLTSNADQLLKALAEVVREVEKCQKPVKSNEQIKQLTRFSTVLTANLISFTELIRNI